MQIIEQLKNVVKILGQRDVKYALGGGLVASIYRAKERTTRDVDFALMAKGDTLKTATDILLELKLQVQPMTKAQLEGGPLHAIKRKKGPIFLLAGRGALPDQVGVDFILPQMPWVPRALERAQSNQIDFGFGKIPCLTVEDIIISKFYSLCNRSDRFSDLDDLQQIFQNPDNKAELHYISDQMMVLSLSVPLALTAFLPSELIKTSKLVKRSLKLSTDM